MNLTLLKTEGVHPYFQFFLTTFNIVFPPDSIVSVLTIPYDSFYSGCGQHIDVDRVATSWLIIAHIARCHCFSIINWKKKTVPTSDRHRRRLIWPAFGRPPVLTSLPSISGQFLRLPLPVSEKAQPHSMDDPFYQPLWDRLRSPYPPPGQ